MDNNQRKLTLSRGMLASVCSRFCLIHARIWQFLVGPDLSDYWQADIQNPEM